jgi:hypothetical protein
LLLDGPTCAGASKDGQKFKPENHDLRAGLGRRVANQERGAKWSWFGCGERGGEVSESAVRAGSYEACERTRDAMVRPLRQRPPGLPDQSEREQTTAATLGSKEPCLVADRNL